MAYQPTRQSLRQHPVPDWFHDAKLGIFIHWGLYSVPAWAPPTGQYGKLTAQEGWTSWFVNNPYAEWYLNSLRIQDSATHQHHLQTYGGGFTYDDFVPLFNKAIGRWNPDDWARLFQQIGARYVVLTTKHHDGFLLWPTEHPNPHKDGYVANRDLVGELASAVRARGMKIGLYYSGGLDWTFNQTPIQDVVDLLTTIPQDPGYVEYANHHWQELIDRYEPAILWNDIGYPAAAELNTLFAGYYNRFPEGLVNDRFSQFKWSSSRLLQNHLVRALVSQVIHWARTRMPSAPANNHHDFRTPEYTSFDVCTGYKWEACRGIGYSFGYNQVEGPDHCIPLPELIRSFVDMVSKNGNLLLNVGPTADGTIPELQRERLLGLGRWLDVNGEAVFGTRPWTTAEGRTGDGIDVRFTHRDNTLYVILLERPRRAQVTIRALQAGESATVHLLGGGALEWRQDGSHLTIALPESLSDSPAYCLRIEPI